MKLRGRVGGRAAAAVAAVLLLGLALAEWSGWPFLRMPLQRIAQAQAGVPVTLDGDFRLRLIGPPSLRVGHLSVGPGDGVDVPQLADANDVALRWQWVDLWRWRRGGALHLEELRADRLDAWLVRHADGRASWNVGGSGTEMPRIGVLAVGGARIEVDDRVADTRLRVVVEGGQANGRQAYRVSAKGNYTGLPLDVVAQAGALLPLLSDGTDAADADLVPLRVDAQVGRTRLHFDGKALALLGGQQLDGVVNLKGPSLGAVGEVLGVTLPRTPAFQLAGDMRLAQDVWHLRVSGATVGGSRLEGNFRYAARATPPMLAGTLNGPRLRFADLGPAVGVGAADAAAPPKSERVLPRHEFDLPSLRAMNADLHIALDELDFGTPALQPLHDLHAHLRLDAGVLRLDDLRAQAAGGTVTGSTRLDGNAKVAEWHAGLAFRDIDVSRWVSGLRKDEAAAAARERRAVPAAEAPARTYLSGKLDADVDVTGKGRSTADILATLDGDVRARLGRGSMSHLVTELIGLDVAQALGVAVRGDRSLPLNCADVALRVDDGVAVTRLAVLDNRDSTIHGTGRVDLRDERLTLRLQARPKDVSLATLRAPVLVEGSLADPDVQIEAGTVAARAAAAIALGVLVTPLAAVLPLVDLGDPESAPCSAASRAAVSAPASAPR